MPYTKNDFPDSMKNLNTAVRNKAIEIVNTLIDDENMDEGIAIPTAISRAKDWAENRGKEVKSSDSDDKDHGKDQYVIPHDQGWALKSEGASKPSQVFEAKKDAVDAGIERAKNHSASITIQRKDGTVEDRYSYNKS